MRPVNVVSRSRVLRASATNIAAYSIASSTSSPTDGLTVLGQGQCPACCLTRGSVLPPAAGSGSYDVARGRCAVSPDRAPEFCILSHPQHGLVAVCRGHSRRNGHGMARGSRRDGGDLAVFGCPKVG